MKTYKNWNTENIIKEYVRKKFLYSKEIEKMEMELSELFNLAKEENGNWLHEFEGSPILVKIPGNGTISIEPLDRLEGFSE